MCLQLGIDIAVQPIAPKKIQHASKQTHPSTPCSLPYSLRNAFIGSIFDARRAGIQLDASATAAIATVIDKNTTGSFGLTPRSRFEANFASANAITSPTANPAPVSHEARRRIIARM